MSRCPYLIIQTNHNCESNKDNYICKITHRQMEPEDPRITYTCNARCGECYNNCPIYREHT